MAKYKAYPEYQSANSQWIDIIPLEWTRVALKFVVSAKITDGPHETPNFIDDGVPFLSAEAIKLNKLDFSRKRAYISFNLHEKYSLKCLPQRDDIFMVKSGNTTGAVAIVETDEIFNIWSPLALIRCNKEIIAPRYVYYSMLADFFQTSVQLSWSQGTQPNIGMGVIENLHLTYPELTVQNKIVSFLDHETAKIDNLIEKQQQLIELLKEKRQAVISHAVTKGLNPDVPMKDSGVEWLGDVPEHWDVKKLKHIASIIDCKNRTPEYFDDGEYLVVRTTNVKKQSLILDGALYTNERDYKIWTDRGVPPVGSILFTREAPAGEVCIVPENTKLCMGQRMMNFICHDTEYTKFLFDYLTSDCLKRYIDSEAAGSTVSHLRVEQVYNIPIVIPPYAEQKQIDDIVGNIKSQYSKLISNAEHSLLLLQERRTALISAAVTGKIDVRNWVAPDTSDIEASEEATA